MIAAFGWEVIESYGESWILLGTPGGGKIGYMQHKAEPGIEWPYPMSSFRSDQIETDIADLKSKGLEVSDVTKSETMWHASYVDNHGNKFLIWQAPE